jgi:hypothetical protein
LKLLIMQLSPFLDKPVCIHMDGFVFRLISLLRRKREADHSPTYSAEVKNTWGYQVSVCDYILKFRLEYFRRWR